MPNEEIARNVSVDKRIEVLVRLGTKLGQMVDQFRSGQKNELNSVLKEAKIENPWYDEKNVLIALENWTLALKKDAVKRWIEAYLNQLNDSIPKKVGVINAGNIPLSGLHDMLCVLISGNNYIAKNASNDSILLPFIAEQICTIEHSLTDRINFVPKLEQLDAVIATGSNNSSRYFEYYFGKYPHVIRKNRNGVGVIQGNETKEQLNTLGRDIFTYYGLGCRNVSKVFVPRGYKFDTLFESIYDFNEIMMHSKYMNNFDYNNSVFLLKGIPFLQNGFLIITQDDRIASPVSILYYEEYDDLDSLKKLLKEKSDQIQCIVADEKFFSDENELATKTVSFGKTQSPALWDYADGVDTMLFLSNIKYR